MRTSFEVPHGLASVHPLGMGLDLFFDRHDSERVFGWGGVLRNDYSVPPPFSFSPETCHHCRGAQKEGRGPIV